MSQKFTKLLLSLLLIILTISSLSICFATDAVTTSETEENSEAITTFETDATPEEDPNHYGDLYLIDSTVVIDKVIYGNVYVFANTVDITGQIEGNLFVFANTLNFDSALVGGNIYACANSISYNGACTYLYSLSNNIYMSFDSYVVKDAKIGALNADIRSAIGRNMDLNCITLDFGEGTDIPLIYGNLKYSSFVKPNIPEGMVSNNIEEQITYISPFSYSLVSILIVFVSTIITVLVLYIILNKITPSFVEKLSSQKLSVINLLKAFGLGLATIILVALVSILLLLTIVGAKLGIILLCLFTALCFIAVPVLSITIAKALKTIFKLEKTYMFLLLLSLVSIVLYGLTLIPFAGIILSIIIKVTAIGLIVYNYLPHKGLTDEEKASKAEAKKLAKEEKAKRKQEKLEAKKLAKLEAKKKANTDL